MQNNFKYNLSNNPGSGITEIENNAAKHSGK